MLTTKNTYVYSDLPSKQDLLNSINELDVYYKYTNSDIQLGRTTRSPFREDRNPSFVFFKSSWGEVIWKDFATGESGDFISFVSKMLGINYYDATNVIYNQYKDFCNIIITNKRDFEQKPRIKSIIEVYNRSWNNTYDKDYWGSFSLNCEILNQYNVYPLKEVSINGHRYKETIKEPIYGYYFGDGYWKIYKPLSDKNIKWFSNTNSDIIQGHNNINENGNLLVITKSLKDVMIYKLLGINSIAPQSEHIVLNDNIINDYKSRFNIIITNFDYDSAGIRLTNLYNEKFGFNSMTFKRKYKDISDYIKVNGLIKTDKTIKRLLKNLI